MSTIDFPPFFQLGSDIDGEAAGDFSGYSVSLSVDGNRVAIGAPGNDGNGNLSGHTRVYEWNSMSMSWTQMGADIDGEAGFDASGYSVSLSADGNRVAIGAIDNNGNGTDSGHTRVYDFKAYDTNPYCSAESNNSIKLNWCGSELYEYCLYQNNNSSPTIVTGSDEIQSQTFNSLNPGTTYTYSIEVKDQNNNIVWTTDELTCVTTCILPGAVISTLNGSKLIEDIVKGDIVINEFGKQVEVINNIKFGFGNKKVITFEAGSLNFNLPTDKLSITYGHPIKIPNKDGEFSNKENLVQDLVNSNDIKMESVTVDCTYALMTEERDFILTNGVPVCTWSVEGFEECCNNYKQRKMIMLYKLL
jgi:hypothetical protein